MLEESYSNPMEFYVLIPAFQMIRYDRIRQELDSSKNHMKFLLTRVDASPMHVCTLHSSTPINDSTLGLFPL